MKLKLYMKDGVHTIKGRANKEQLFHGIKQDMAFSKVSFDIYEDKVAKAFIVKDINAVVLETKHNHPVETIISVEFEGGIQIMEYVTKYQVEAHHDKIIKARENDYSFISFDGLNCKAAVRTSCLK